MIKPRSQPRRFRMEFTSMIDVVFLLLIFFMCTMKFKTLESKLATYLPTDKGLAPQFEPMDAIEPIRIGLSMSGERCTCSVNGRVIGIMPEARSALYQRIAAVRRALPESPAIITPDPAVKHGHVVAAVDECMRARIDKITFAGALPKLEKRSS